MEHRILAGATSSFAHLVGLARPKSVKAEDDKDRKEDAKAEDSDPKDDDKKDAKAADDKPSDDDKDKKDAKAAEPDDEDDEKDDKKSKAKADDDDDDEEMTGKGSAAAARQRERARCAAIFSCPQAAQNVAFAAHLAFETNLTRKQAVDLMSKAPIAPAASSGREARNPNLGAGAAQPSGPQAVAASWDAAFKKTARK
jgi:hypothetical protein